MKWSQLKLQHERHLWAGETRKKMCAQRRSPVRWKTIKTINLMSLKCIKWEKNAYLERASQRKNCSQSTRSFVVHIHIYFISAVDATEKLFNALRFQMIRDYVILIDLIRLISYFLSSFADRILCFKCFCFDSSFLISFQQKRCAALVVLFCFTTFEYCVASHRCAQEKESLEKLRFKASLFFSTRPMHAMHTRVTSRKLSQHSNLALLEPEKVSSHMHK